MKTLLLFPLLFKESFKSWRQSSASEQSELLAYNAIFSLPGLLIVIVWILGAFMGDEAIRGEIEKQVSGIAGKPIAESLQNMISSATLDQKNTGMKIVGIISLVFGSTTLFFQMQKALNTVWGVQPAPKKAIEKYFLDRANSLGMVLIIAFLLLISLVLSSLIGLTNNWIIRHFNLETFLMIRLLNFLSGVLISTILFALIFKVLPDVEIPWKTVGLGALVTAILFAIGKFILSIYFEVSKPESVFGAAGTIILLMLWVNYTCQILFFGAQFTKNYAKKRNHKITPSLHAKWDKDSLFFTENLTKL